MAADAEFKDYVLDQLRELDEVVAKRMFSGWGLYHRGVFFGIVSRGRHYLKTDAAFRELFVDAGTGPFQPTAKMTLKTYYEVPAEVLEDACVLGEWARRAVACKLADGED
ncbi:MAG: competence protein TfoX [Planctomycetaceae bacterium]|jgi:DNA transformation protein|nr:competence protein TfoX [Planctomycetaceae bacterium]